MWTDGTYTSATSTTGPRIVITGDASFTTENGTGVEAKQKGHMPTQIFFKLMKKKMGVLKDRAYKARIKKLEQKINEVTAAGQIAFGEEMMKKLFVLTREAELWAIKKRIYLTREIYDKFKYKTKRKVQLTPIKNYARPIPDDVMAEKEKYASYYDDFYIMHYDDASTVKETEEERIEREKDPILFGTIEYSNRLYYIADWEDEYCDLTLDDIIDKLDLEDEDIVMSKQIEI